MKILKSTIWFFIVLILFGCVDEEKNTAHPPKQIESKIKTDEDTLKRKNKESSYFQEVVAPSFQFLEDPLESGGNPTSHLVAKGANSFAFEFSSTLLKTSKSDNFLCSPYSVWLSLSALANGTQGEKQEQLLRVLGSEGLTTKDINRAASRMLYNLTYQTNPDVQPIEIANAIFLKQGYPLKKPFLESFSQSFAGSLFQVDFLNPNTPKAINSWVSKNTHGLIKEIITKFPRGTIMSTASTLYFSDRWTCEFDPNQTKKDVFYSPFKEIDALYMYKKEDRLPYYETENVQAISLDFLSGGKLYIFRPKDKNATGFLSTLDEKTFYNLTKKLKPQTGILLLPKFEIQTDSLDLIKPLKALGVSLFDPEKINFPLITESKMYITDFLQKSTISVDEKGTTSAAVTLSIEGVTSVPPETEPFFMNCNTPFVFVLCSHTYDGGNQVLFVGTINAPIPPKS